MPIYEYHCLVCKRDFEKLVMTSTAEVGCTNCGSELLEKKFSLFGSKVGERVGSFGPSGGGGGGSCGCGSCTCHYADRHTVPVRRNRLQDLIKPRTRLHRAASAIARGRAINQAPVSSSALPRRGP